MSINPIIPSTPTTVPTPVGRDITPVDVAPPSPPADPCQAAGDSLEHGVAAFDEAAFFECLDAIDALEHTQFVEVQPGDSLSALAKKYCGDASRWPELYELNKEAIGANPNLIHPGEILRIPTSWTLEPAPADGTPAAPAGGAAPAEGEQVTVTVQAGDTLTGIAHAVTGAASNFDEIHAANRPVIGDDPDEIRPGQTLVLPEALHGEVLAAIAETRSEERVAIDMADQNHPKPGETTGDALRACQERLGELRAALKKIEGEPDHAAYAAKVGRYAEAIAACLCL